MRGVTTSCLKPLGTTPSDKEQLTSLVIEGSTISRQSLTKKVGHGSSWHDLDGEFVFVSELHLQIPPKKWQ